MIVPVLVPVLLSVLVPLVLLVLLVLVRLVITVVLVINDLVLSPRPAEAPRPRWSFT